MCEFYDCRNVLIEGVSFTRSPFWTLHPVFCTNVTIRGVHVHRGTTNDDGCDPDSCRDVLIEDCEFDTADDSISIKAGRDRDAWGGRPCESIVIRRCHSKRTETNAYTIGSEMSGDVRVVFILDCTASETAKSVLYIKSNSDRGGVVENVRVRGVRAEAGDICIQLQTDYKGVKDHAYPPRYRNFHFENVQCGKARRTGISVMGIAGKPIEGLYLKDVTIGSAATAVQIAEARDLKMQNVHINGRLIGQPDEPNQE